jgi:DNA-binding transcriptional LysR family regulator
LLEEDADVVFGVRFDQLCSSGLAFAPLRSLSICIIVDENHRLAREKSIPVSELRHESIIIEANSPQDLITGFSHMFASYGFTPLFEHRSSSNWTDLLTDLRGSVQPWVSGFRISEATGMNTSIVEIEEGRFVCEYGLWYREDCLSPTLQMFIEELTANIDENDV